MKDRFFRFLKKSFDILQFIALAIATFIAYIVFWLAV